MFLRARARFDANDFDEECLSLSLSLCVLCVSYYDQKERALLL